jgi:hypothetical protein
MKGIGIGRRYARSTRGWPVPRLPSGPPRLSAEWKDKLIPNEGVRPLRSPPRHP